MLRLWLKHEPFSKTISSHYWQKKTPAQSCRALIRTLKLIRSSALRLSNRKPLGESNCEPPFAFAWMDMLTWPACSLTKASNLYNLVPRESHSVVARAANSLLGSHAEIPESPKGATTIATIGNREWRTRQPQTTVKSSRRTSDGVGVRSRNLRRVAALIKKNTQTRWIQNETEISINWRDDPHI